MNESKVIKIIHTAMCPHCGKEILVSSKMTSPWIDWVLKLEDIEKAKQTVIAMVEKSTTVSADEKTSLLKWLTSKDTLFGPEDIENVIQQLLGAPTEAPKEEIKK
jgi:hypothetical protein